MDSMISPVPIRIVDLKVDKSKLNLKSLTLTNIGHLPGRTLQRTGATFQKWALVYITGGKGSYRVNHGLKHNVGPGSLFWFYPGAVFDYGPDDHGYWDEYYFNIEGERLNEWLEHWPLRPGAVSQAGTDDALQNKIDRIFMLMESGAPANVDRASLLLESLLYEFIWSADRIPENGKSQHMIQILEDISNSLLQPVDAAKIARRHHISVSTLRRNVCEYTGYPFNEYIHRLKTAEAKNILLNTDLTVKEIADTLGYKDVFYFSRLFKKYVGLAPNVFRKQQI
ncbi:AraC family transcriptional regulator [Paenibacillus piri]|uniref:AraC family transcriptional regulator n=2 Tax=Paenibacillus piri TaxID=2547395 RepID=A0A4R5KLB9_9BACL|nr:AraC family transcriptional regulator [Paenibacillus piri]